MAFWLLAAVLILAVLAVLLWPLAAGRRKNTLTEDAFKVSVYKQRLNEIDVEVREGLVDADQAAAAREEAEHHLLEEIGADVAAGGPADKPEQRFSKGLAMLLGAFLIAAAVPLYLLLGSPEQAATGADQLTAEQHRQSIDAMVNSLEQRLQRDPDDINGWALLNRSYLALGRDDDAVVAAERLYALGGDDPDVLLSYIHTLVTVNGGSFSGKPEELIGKLLVVDPQNTAGMWFAGLAAQQRGDDRQAVVYWKKILPALKDEPEARDRVAQLIKASEDKMAGGTPSQEAPPQVTAQSAPAVVQTPVGKSIKLKVSLAPSLRDKVGPDDTVFIFAKAPSGMPAPLAVLRQRAAELPLQVTLDDSLAMIPTHKLSNYDKVNVVARISRSGGIAAQAGDLEGRQDGVTVTADTSMDLVIDKILE